MLEKYLKIIYDKYYNLNKDTDFMCSRDIIEFFCLRNVENED